MATIGEEIAINLSDVVTNVTDSTPTFNNTVFQNYPTGTQYREDYSIYENTGDDIIVSVYDTGATYVVDDVVYRDGLVQKCVATEGDVAKQPENYTAIDTNLNKNNWSNRYVKFKDLNEGYSPDGVNVTSLGSFHQSDVFLSSDGTKLFELFGDISGNSVATKVGMFTLSTPWDLSTAVDSGDRFDLQPTITTANGFHFNTDGTKMFVYGYGGSYKVFQFALSSAWDITTASLTTSYTTSVNALNCSLTISSDGTKMWIGSSSNVYKYTLNTPWSLSSVTYNGYSTHSPISFAGFTFNSDGTKLYVSDANTESILEFELSTPWVISTTTQTAVTHSASYLPRGIAFSADGTKLYEASHSGDFIAQHDMTIAYDLSTAFYSLTNVTNGYNSSGVFHKYEISKSGSTYYFTTTRSGRSDSMLMYAYTEVSDTTNEPTASITFDDDWIGRTLIIRPDGLYVRTNIEVGVEYEATTSPIFSVVSLVSSIPGFSRLTNANPYKPFDGRNVTPAIYSSPMNYTIRVNESFNAVTLSKVLGDSVTYTFTLPTSDENYDLWLDGVAVESGGNGVVKKQTATLNCNRDCDGILSKYPTTRIFYSNYQMPAGSIASISISRSSGTIELGDLTANNTIPNGMTDLEFNHSYQDYNDYTPDAFGEIAQATKPIVVKFDISMDILLENYDLCVAFHNSIAGKFVTIDGSDSNGESGNGISIFTSLTKRVLVTASTHKSVIKDGSLWRMAGLRITALEII